MHDDIEPEHLRHMGLQGSHLFVMLLAIVNILIYKRIYQNKIIFTISSILYSYLSINFLTVFICDYKEIPYPFWTFH